MKRKKTNPTKLKDIVRANKVSLLLQSRKCNRPTCKKCLDNIPHGFYWYAYWYDKKLKKMKSLYIGKELPDHIRIGKDKPL